jgi:DNA polymerase-3 subunit beta
MNITLEKKEFGDAVSTTSRFAERKSATLPVLGSVTIEAEGGKIWFRATNLETSITLEVPGQMKSAGVLSLPATILREITSSLSGTGTLTLESDGDTAKISSGSLKSVLKTLPSEDFPALEGTNTPKTSFTLPGTLVKSLIQSVASCASPSTVRPELASVLISAEGGVVKSVATDSFRLAEKKLSISGSVKPFSMLIPAKNAIDIASTIPDDDIEVKADDHQCTVTWKQGSITTRLVAANYPDYAQIIPKTSAAEAQVLKKDFDAALRRTAVFSDAFQKIRLGIDPGKKQVTLAAQNNDVGTSDEALPAAVKGDELTLSFNYRYLQAPISLIGAESLTLSAAGIGRALTVRGAGDSSFLYLVMPMNQ